MMEKELFTKVTMSKTDYGVGSPRSSIAIINAFKNRKNESAYLKNTFPAGFGSDTNLKSSSSSEGKSEIISKSGLLGRSGSASFVSWTKGGSEFGDEESTIGTADPYANVAGPYYNEIMKPKDNKSLHSSQPTVTNDSDFCLVSTGPMSMISRTKMNSTVTKYEDRKRVFQQPSSMPYLSATLTGGGSSLSPEVYENWLSYQRSDVGEKVWQKKGKDSTYNYSSRDFKADAVNDGDVRIIYTDRIDRDADIIPIREVPKVMPPFLTVEIFTQNQLLKSSTVLFDRSILFKKVSSTMSIMQVKNMVIEEIIAGIAKTFKIDNKASKAGDLLDVKSLFNLQKIDLLFQYFHPIISSWRVINSEVDWLHAKQLCMQHYDSNNSTQKAIAELLNPNHLHHTFPQRDKELQLHEIEEGKITLMYALDKHSEQYILRVMEQYREKRKKLMEESNEHISLKLLTDALANMTGSFKMKGQSHTNLAHSGGNAVQAKTSTTKHSGEDHNDK